MRFRTLQLRFLVSLLLGAAVFALVVGALTYQISYRQTVQSATRSIEDLLAAVEKTAAVGAFTSDSVLMQEVVEGIGRNGFVITARMRNTSGVEALHRSASANASGPAPMVIERQLRSPFDASEAVGNLRIETDVARIQASARRQASLLAFVMVLQVVLLSLLLYIEAERFVSRPIVRLAAMLGKVIPGSSERLPISQNHKHDEIGVLISGANGLLEATDKALDRERRLRAEVEAIQAQYRQIFDSTSAGIFVLDRRRMLINANPTVLKLIDPSGQSLGFDSAERFVEAAFSEPAQIHRMMDEAVAKAGAVAADVQLACPTARWVHCLLSFRGGADEPEQGTSFFEGVMYDVTERKLIEHAAQEAKAVADAQRLQAEVVALRMQNEVAEGKRKRELAIERQREQIVRDLHDGLGSRLTTSLALVQFPELDRSLLASTLRECIDDLKLTIDSIEPIDGNLVTLVASLRYRLEKRFEAAGIAFEWAVNELPLLPWLEASDSVSIMRIFQEALSNAIKHAHPRIIRVQTDEQVRHGRAGVQVSIVDDGGGFDPTQLSSGGRGLNNMKTRAAAVGGHLEVRSRPGRTDVVLWLPVARPRTDGDDDA